MIYVLRHTCRWERMAGRFWHGQPLYRCTTCGDVAFGDEREFVPPVVSEPSP